MTWTKLDDDFPDRDAILGLSDAAFRLHVTGIIVSNRLLTDGQITALRAAKLTASDAVLEELVEAGVWVREGDGYRIVDSLEDQPTAAKVRAQRKANADRVARWRGRRKASRRNGVRNGITNGVSNAAPVPLPKGRDAVDDARLGVVVDTDERTNYDPQAYERAVLEGIDRRSRRLAG